MTNVAMSDPRTPRPEPIVAVAAEQSAWDFWSLFLVAKPARAGAPPGTVQDTTGQDVRVSGSEES